MGKNTNTTLDDVKEHKDEIDWILTKQAELRAELMAFYKKDLKEIQAALNNIDSKEGSPDSFTKQVLEDAHKNFIDQWRRSYGIITPIDNSSHDM